jgi:nucleotide-binding universal stress UspA family protein
MTADPWLEVSGLDDPLVEGAVVVGDDGSEDAARAVRWAHADALRRSVPLVLVRGWSITTAPRPGGDSDLGYVPSEEEFAGAVREAMAADVQAVLGEVARSSVALLPVHRSAQEALVEASRRAAVTVVGARGSGLAKWLGSVSTSVVKQAHGPVVVVPGDGVRGF